MLPFAGQGAAQAIEDGVALAAALDACDDHADAFERYQRERKARADRIRSESHWLGRLATTQSTVLARVRNRAMGLLPGHLFRRLRRRRVTDTSLPPASGEHAVAPDPR
jgi:2-polyprenyl-6-methoxyphenol hydroxylase-like FAD-dependent oxidoreductase